jgi:hypothetical protein
VVVAAAVEEAAEGEQQQLHNQAQVRLLLAEVAAAGVVVAVVAELPKKVQTNSQHCEKRVIHVQNIHSRLRLRPLRQHPWQQHQAYRQ